MIGVIGGFIGQLVLVLNTIKKHYSRLDIPIKSRTSSRKNLATPNRPKTGESSNKEEVKDGVSQAESIIEQEHQILDKQKIQKFIYDYILEKQKVEKMSIQVDPEFEHYLKNGLKVPLELNNMRTMKEPNYSAFRELIREKAGGYVLNMMRDN